MSTQLTLFTIVAAGNIPWHQHHYVHTNEFNVTVAFTSYIIFILSIEFPGISAPDDQIH